MSTVQPDIALESVDRLLGLAVDAWASFCASSGRLFAQPRAVIALKPQRRQYKSGVYRLDGSGDDGSAVIAKRCLRAAAAVERTIHERVLPRVGMSRLRFYGHMEDADAQFSWLFMEDGGSEKLLQTDGELAAG